MGKPLIKRAAYSAGAVKCSFWFQEFRIMVTLLSQRKTLSDIKQMNIDDNIFSAPTAARASQIFNTVSLRALSLSACFYDSFQNHDVASQKLIALISVMNTDGLFFEFMYEVYREKLIIGDDRLHDSDIRIFFGNKQLQDERVAKWQDCTLKRLGVFYKSCLTESGVAVRNDGGLTMIKPVLDADLVDLLLNNDMRRFVAALTGV